MTTQAEAEKLLADNARLLRNVKNRVLERNMFISATSKAEARVKELEAAISKTLADNGHLADGDNCTLIELKKVMGL